MFSSATEDALKTFWMTEFENIASYFPSKIICNNDPLSGGGKKEKEKRKQKSVSTLKQLCLTRPIQTKTYTTTHSRNESSFTLQEKCSCTESTAVADVTSVKIDFTELVLMLQYVKIQTAK